MHRAWTLVGTLFLVSTVALAQPGVDLTSLEQRLDDAQAAYSRVEQTVTASERTSLERELSEMRDDLTYLRVKSRRGERVTDRESQDLTERIERFMTRTNGRSLSTSTSGRRAIPVSTELDVRLQTPLNSGRAQVEDRVEATTMVDLYQGDDLLVPAGSLLTGYVAAVDSASRTDRQGSVALKFTTLTVNGRAHDVQVSVTKALESEGLKGEAARIGVGAGVGAIIGGILGGTKGAIAGILIGGSGVLVATEGKDVDLAVGTVLRVRFDSEVPLER
jgi:hypothetical protein